MIHLVFHMSSLRKFISYLRSIVPLENVDVKENFTCGEILMEIFNKQVKTLQNKEVPLIKVLWTN